MRIRLLAVLACATVVLVLPSASNEAVPPNRNDPCASGGQDTCGTAGVGFYKTYSFGTRWFGDFKAALPGKSHLFCIDLRFWYPSASYQYREDQNGTLRNREGNVVALESRQRLAYAIWTFGQTSDPNQQAAVMLYVHSLMGDARAGELDPGAIGAAVATQYTQIARDSAAYHGPYHVELRVPPNLAVTKQATATIRVLAASGKPVPGVALSLSGTSAAGLAGQVRTSAAGAATVSFTPSGGTVALQAKALDLPSTLPRIFEPTTAAAAANGQRLALADSQDVAAGASATATKNKIAVSTIAVPATLAVGEQSRDQVTISGASPAWHGTVTTNVYGPFASLAQVSCAGTAVWHASFPVGKVGTFTSPPATLAQAGWYTYVQVVPGDAGNTGLTTPCGVAAESFRAQAKPTLQTTVSSQRVGTGTPIFDKVHVQGLAGQAVTVQASLYGPFATKAAISCAGTAVWTGTIDVKADGDYQTAPFTPTAPGYYTYRERIDATDLVKAVETACAEEAESSLVVAKPKVTTAVSVQTTAVGSTVTDKLTVTGLGALAAPVKVDLFGPFATTAAVLCTGTAYATETVATTGDGAYTTQPVTLKQAGYYT
jgi:hypothetical protein